MYKTVAWGKTSKENAFSKMTIERNLPGPDDVTVDVKYCGICHTDIHFANNFEGNTQYPMVPGHELAGIAAAVGSNVTDIAVGDKVGIGCVVDSCMNCFSCSENMENFCEKGMTMAYCYPLVHGHLKTNLGYSLGGYCGSYTVNKKYIVKIPLMYPLEAAGPLFCAAITMYSPLVHWQANKGGKHVGIIGIGGLGQMGVKIARAMGNKVTAISTSPNKREAAMEMGADQFVVSSDPESMLEASNTMDLLLNTVSAKHEVSTYIPLLRRDGALVQLGSVRESHQLNQMDLLFKRLQVAGSLMGGLSETQDCMDFCAQHKIVPEIKLVKASDLDMVYTALEKKSDQAIRYVLDIEAS